MNEDSLNQYKKLCCILCLILLSCIWGWKIYDVSISHKAKKIRQQEIKNLKVLRGTIYHSGIDVEMCLEILNTGISITKKNYYVNEWAFLRYAPLESPEDTLCFIPNEAINLLQRYFYQKYDLENQLEEIK